MFETLMVGLMTTALGLIPIVFVVAFFKFVVPELRDVRWKFVGFHSMLGFTVSCLVAPTLPAAFCMAAGILSTITVAVVIAFVESAFEVKKPARSRVRS